MPVLMSYLPVPSRLMAAAMRVSLVARATNARRPPVPGVVSVGVETAFLALGEAFLTAFFTAPFQKTAGPPGARDACKTHARQHDQPAQDAGRGQRIAEKGCRQGHRR